MNDYSERTLVEEPAIAHLESLGWQHLSGYSESYGIAGTFGRDNKGQVVLPARLLPALRRLNPAMSDEALTAAADELTRDRSAQSLAAANREVYRLLRDGVRVTVRHEDEHGVEQPVTELVRLIDWNDPAANDFLLVSQFSVSGVLYTRRADLVGFVNGMPLVFIELKGPREPVESAYIDNFRDYRSAIPQLFWYNAVVILSNGSRALTGSVTAPLEFFTEWKKVESETEPGRVALETALNGICRPDRLLDLVENFAVFQELPGGLVKIVARYHQVLGVNNAIAGLRDIKDRQGRLGVYWHTQGSGKSISMIYFTQKALRKLAGDYTFVIVTDRQELDEQIYRNFATAGVITDKEVHAESAAHLRGLLAEDHRYVFTLIQKFRSPDGARQPVLSARSNIIVITDEAHRSQYDLFAANMRAALPNAAFLGFTGTPLMAGEERTRAVFGEYVSTYTFRQSIEDGATVPLYYENRIPELELTNEQLNTDLENLLDDAALDDAAEVKLEREFAREYQVITRDDRLERIAEDIAAHFTSRGTRGKAMVIAVDKATAIKMYDKVQAHWQRRINDLLSQSASALPDSRAAVDEKIAYLQSTDMAVVVSEAQNEVADLRDRYGVDITPHRERMKREKLDDRFKDEHDPLRIVFVCAMWMTGFDAPPCNTIYLDRPMRNHTLMQTIARANRVFPGKQSGLIVDYIGIFRDLQRALAIWATGTGADPADQPIKPKHDQFAAVQAAADALTAYFAEHRIDPAAIAAATGFDKVELFDQAIDAVLVTEEVKVAFFRVAGVFLRAHNDLLPNPDALEFSSLVALTGALLKRLRTIAPQPAIDDVMREVERLLDESVAAHRYVIHGEPEERVLDLSQIDFDALREKFKQGHQQTRAEALRGAVNAKIAKLLRLNRTRMNFYERYQQLLAEYNGGAAGVEDFFNQLVTLARDLTEEEERAVRQDLSEEQLAIVDLLTRPGPNLTDAEVDRVKRVARDLVTALHASLLVLDWRKRQQTRSSVKVAIQDYLDQLPDAYDKAAYDEKVDQIYQHIFDSYTGEGSSVYAAPS